MNHAKKFMMTAMIGGLVGCGISAKSQASELMAAMNVNLQEVFRGAGHTFSDLHTQEFNALSRATAGNSGEFFSPTSVIGARFSQETAGAIELDMNLEQLPRFLREQLRFILARYPKSTFVLSPEQRPGEAKSVRLSVVNGQKQAVFSLKSSKESFEFAWNHGDSKANDPFFQQISGQKNAVFSLGEQPLSKPEQNIIKNAFLQKAKSTENLKISWKVKAHGLSVVNITEPDFDGKAGPLQSEIQASRLKEKLRQQKLQQQEESQKKEQGLEQKLAQEQTDHGQTRKERDGLADDKKDLVEKKETLEQARVQAEAPLNVAQLAQGQIDNLKGEWDTVQQEAKLANNRIGQLINDLDEKQDTVTSLINKLDEAWEFAKIQTRKLINLREKLNVERIIHKIIFRKKTEEIKILKGEINRLKESLFRYEDDSSEKENTVVLHDDDEDDIEDDDEKVDVLAADEKAEIEAKTAIKNAFHTYNGTNRNQKIREDLVQAYVLAIASVLSKGKIMSNPNDSFKGKENSNIKREMYKSALTYMENLFNFSAGEGSHVFHASRNHVTFCAVEIIGKVLTDNKYKKAGKIMPVITPSILAVKELLRPKEEPNCFEEEVNFTFKDVAKANDKINKN